MKPLFGSSLTLLVCCLFSGCVQVDYFGQSFDPTPETSPVEYYTSKNDIPAGKYRIIGRGTIATELDVGKYDIREALIEAARKHGADAVATVSVTRVPVGVYPRDENFDGSPTHPSSAESFNPSSSHAVKCAPHFSGSQRRGPRSGSSYSNSRSVSRQPNCTRGPYCLVTGKLFQPGWAMPAAMAARVVLRSSPSLFGPANMGSGVFFGKVPISGPQPSGCVTAPKVFSR